MRATAHFSDGLGAVAKYLQRFFVVGVGGALFFIGQMSICPPRSGGRYFYVLSGAALAAASEGLFVYLFTDLSGIKIFPAGNNAGD
ncbi:hypothetical protein EVU22_19210 [Salmonella enterica subsp. enterica serovar Mbandaka]|nr:hypothetical protein [Salmonella enterica subsp. enterica serovar Mbandaka]